jgi:diguanylate cyclase (GGDEF)-like protein
VVRTRATWVLAVLIGASVYYGITRLGSAIAYAPGGSAAAWPATGVALALLWLGGPRMLPAVLIGELAGDLSNGVALGLSVAFAAASATEALVAYALLRRVGFRARLDRVRDVVALLVLAAPVSTAVGATIGCVALLLHGNLAPGDLWSAWHLWWMTDLIRDLVVAPLLLVAATMRPSLPRGRRLAETIALLVVLGALGVTASRSRSGDVYLMFPVLIWAALRFRQGGAVIANTALAAVALVGAAGGTNHLDRISMLEQILFTRNFVAVGALTTLVLAALLSERDRSAHALRRAEMQTRALGEVTAAIAREQPLDTVLTLIERHATTWRDPERHGAGGHDGDLILEGLGDLAELAAANDRTRRRLLIEATTDPLTGLYNRRAFSGRLAEEIERSHRYGRPLSIVVMDLDGFKAVNDTAGHAAGDRVLTDVAGRIEAAIRLEALVARLGGDELAIVLPECDGDGAYAVAERVREAIRVAPAAGGERITISAGIAELGGGDDGDDVMAAADVAVYAAKRMGGNTSVRHTPGMSGRPPVSASRRAPDGADAARSA